MMNRYADFYYSLPGSAVIFKSNTAARTAAKTLLFFVFQCGMAMLAEMHKQSFKRTLATQCLLVH
jgi:hypothetical protein